MILIAGALLVAASGFLFRRDVAGPFDRTRFRYSVMAEGAGIAIVLLVCIPLQRSDLIMPLIGMVVGLHFVPLAKVFGDRAFVTVGCLMAGVSLAALLWLPPLRQAISGVGGGILLWGFALWTSLLRGRMV